MTRDDPAAFAPPPAFGPFRVLHQIGIGALGPVFRTYEPTRDRLVAVKIFRLDITPEQSDALAAELGLAADAGLFHPSIVEPIAAGVQGTVAYRAEEYVAAESLDIAIRHYAPASLQKTLPFITQLAGAIDFARSAGIGHGALHLRDVFVTPDEARAGGFGVVEALERLGIRAPVRRPYSAPERIAGESWGTPADVFSLGAIAFEMLTARRPSGTGGEIGEFPEQMLGPHAAAIHGVLARAMDDSPVRRYPSALALASALEAASRGGHVSDAVRAVGAISAATAAPPDPDDARTADVPLAPQRARSARRAPRPKPMTGEAPGVPDGIDGPGTTAGVAATSAMPDIPTFAAAAPVGPALEVVPDGISDKVGAGAVVDARVVDTDPDAGAHEVAAERDADAAHHELLRREVQDMPQPMLFDDDEAASDLALHAGHASRDVNLAELDREDWRQAPATAALGHDELGHEFSAPEVHLAWHVDDGAPNLGDGRAPAYGERVSSAGDDAPALILERSKPAMLPLAIVLVVGLLVGFAAGYAVADRGPSSAAPTAAAVAPPVAAPAITVSPALPPSARPQEGGRAFSEQAVGPSSAAPPPVPGDGPSDRIAEPRQRAAVRSAAAPGRLVVFSTPPKAAVVVNGRWRGRTPLTLDGLQLGNYAVRIVEPGFATLNREVTLTARDPVLSLAVRLEPGGAAPPAASGAAGPAVRTAAPPSASARSAGTLYVDSRPRGASVTIDGRAAGTTPARVPDVGAGTHVVRLELADHRPWTASKLVAAGRETRVTGSLERIR